MPELNGKPGRRWLRFSLRFLLLAMAVIAVPLGWKFNRVWNRRIAVAEVTRLGGRVAYEHLADKYWSHWGTTVNDPPPGHFPDPLPETPGPRLLKKLLGDDFFFEVTRVELIDKQLTDVTISKIGKLSNLKSLELRSDGLSDYGMAQIARLNELESLTIHARNITNDGLRRVTRCRKLKQLRLREAVNITDPALADIAALPHLEFLLLDAEKVGDAGFRHLTSLASLRGASFGLPRVTDVGLQSMKQWRQIDNLALRKMKIADSGLEAIATLGSLKRILFMDTPIRDDNLHHLYGMKNLIGIEFQRTAVTGEGAKRLRKALPRCFVQSDHWNKLTFGKQLD